MAGASRGKTDNLHHLENEVSEVTSLLRDNVDRVLERGERIDSLQSRSEDLQCSSSHFKRSAVQVRKRMWWKNCKMTCIIGSVIFLIIAVVVIIILVETKPWESSSDKGGGGGKTTTTARPTTSTTTIRTTTPTLRTTGSTSVSSTSASTTNSSLLLESLLNL